jgi:ribonucleotide monophosphatase NagD (HAD superfamily)
MVGALKATTNKEPVVVGKPSTFLMDYLASEYNLFLHLFTLSVPISLLDLV